LLGWRPEARRREVAVPRDDVRELISDTLRRAVDGGTKTRYREPIVGFAAASDPRFDVLRKTIVAGHMLPGDLLRGAVSVVSFFFPFSREVVESNARSKTDVAWEWAVAYTETNRLIEDVSHELIGALAARDVRAVSEPPTGRFDRNELKSLWSHKSVALVAGLGGFGVHRMLITESGCAGRFGSLVVDCELPRGSVEPAQRCLHRVSGGCLECVKRCPVEALREDGTLDRKLCWARCRSAAVGFRDLSSVEVCGKCAVGPCALRSAV
jgi:epoxyqueuosine reductase